MLSTISTTDGLAMGHPAETPANAHVARNLGQVGVDTRQDAVARGHERGLLPSPADTRWYPKSPPGDPIF